VKPVLCVRRGGLGDTILCLPLLRALRARWPAAPLHFAGVPEFGGVLLRYAAVDLVRSSEALQLWALGAGGPMADAARARLAGYRAVYGDAPELALLGDAGPEVAVFDPLPRGTDVHAADWPLRQLGLPDPVPAAVPLLARRPDPGPDAPVLLHPGAGSVRKRWPRECWLELAAALAAAGNRVCVAAGPTELAGDDPLRWPWPTGTAHFADGTGCAWTLAQALLAARACVGNDSGAVHLSAALGVPTVAVFGPTDPRVWAPRGVAVQVVGWRTYGCAREGAAEVLDALAAPLRIEGGADRNCLAQ
jgi:heptosyltransferase-3